MHKSAYSCVYAMDHNVFGSGMHAFLRIYLCRITYLPLIYRSQINCSPNTAEHYLHLGKCVVRLMKIKHHDIVTVNAQSSAYCFITPDSNHATTIGKTVSTATMKIHLIEDLSPSIISRNWLGLDITWKSVDVNARSQHMEINASTELICASSGEMERLLGGSAACPCIPRGAAPVLELVLPSLNPRWK